MSIDSSTTPLIPEMSPDFRFPIDVSGYTDPVDIKILNEMILLPNYDELNDSERKTLYETRRQELEYLRQIVMTSTVKQTSVIKIIPDPTELSLAS